MLSQEGMDDNSSYRWYIRVYVEVHLAASSVHILVCWTPVTSGDTGRWRETSVA